MLRRERPPTARVAGTRMRVIARCMVESSWPRRGAFPVPREFDPKSRAFRARGTEWPGRIYRASITAGRDVLVICRPDRACSLAGHLARNRLASSGMTRDELKRKVFAAIDRRAEEIVGLGERIRN